MFLSKPGEPVEEAQVTLLLSASEAAEFREITMRGLRDNTSIDVEVCAFLLARSGG